MKAVIDTNILIDYLNGIEAAREELSNYRQKTISVITHIEVLAGVKTDEEESVVRAFLGTFDLKDLSREIAEQSVLLREEYRMKIPDAIVYATARMEGCMLVSRNTKDFDPAWPDVRMPYHIRP